jgi:hypothetical protein
MLSVERRPLKPKGLMLCKGLLVVATRQISTLTSTLMQDTSVECKKRKLVSGLKLSTQKRLRHSWIQSLLLNQRISTLEWTLSVNPKKIGRP